MNDKMNNIEKYVDKEKSIQHSGSWNTDISNITGSAVIDVKSQKTQSPEYYDSSNIIRENQEIQDHQHYGQKDNEPILQQDEEMPNSEVYRDISYTSTSEQFIRSHLRKLYPRNFNTGCFRFSAIKVRVGDYDGGSLRGTLEVLSGPKSLRGSRVAFHRNDFKNKFWLVKVLVLLQIEFTVIVVALEKEEPRLVCVHKEFLQGIKSVLQSYDITRDKLNHVNFIFNI